MRHTFIIVRVFFKTKCAQNEIVKLIKSKTGQLMIDILKYEIFNDGRR